MHWVHTSGLLWLGLAGPAGADRVGLVLEVDGAPANVGQQAHEHMHERLGGGSFALVDIEPMGPCDASCRVKVAEANSVAYLVRVSVRAEGSDYTIRTELVDGKDGSVIDARDQTCEICTHDEAAEAIGAEAGAFGEAIELAIVDTQSAEPAAEPEPIPAQERRKPEVKRTVGWTAIGVGVGMLAGGITLLAKHHRPYSPKCGPENTDVDGFCEFRYKTLGGGVLLTIAGIGAAATGAILLVLDRRDVPRVEGLLGPASAGVRVRF